MLRYAAEMKVSPNPLAGLVPAAIVAVLLGPVRAQEDAVLAAQVLAALGSKQFPGIRPGLDDKAPVCPGCGKGLREVPLWEERGGIDWGPGRITALVCLADQLFTVRSRSRGMGVNGDCGPFALPAPGAVPPRRRLPWGSVPLPDEATKLRAETSIGVERSPDGSVVMGSGHGGELVVWNGEKTLFEDRSEMGVTACALSDDGRLLAFARSMGPVRVIALDTGKERCRFRLGPVNVMQIAFAPGGDRLVFAPIVGDDQGTLELGSSSGGKSRTLGRLEPEVPTAFAWLPQHGTVVTGSFSGVIRALALDGSGERWSVSLGEPVDGLAAAPDGSRVCATGNGGLSAVVLDGARGEVQRRASIAKVTRVRQEFGSTIAWSGDSRSYAWVLSDGRIARGEASAPRELQLSPGGSELTGPGGVRLSFTAGGKEVVTATADGSRLQWPIARFPAQQ